MSAALKEISIMENSITIKELFCKSNDLKKIQFSGQYEPYLEEHQGPEDSFWSSLLIVPPSILHIVLTSGMNQHRNIQALFHKKVAYIYSKGHCTTVIF